MGIRFDIPDTLPELDRSLLECGVPACLKCGYGVRGAQEGVCPECGRPLDASVVTVLFLHN